MFCNIQEIDKHIKIARLIECPSVQTVCPASMPPHCYTIHP